MPIYIHGRKYRNFYTARRAVMRWKRIGVKRASAYVAVVMRAQEGRARRYRSRRGLTRRSSVRAHPQARWRIVCHGRTKSWHLKKSTAQHRLSKRMRARGCRVARVR